MEELATILVVALAGGATAHLARLPPLVGFLAAGFALNALGVDEPAGLDLVSDLGVALLLFGIGLRLDLRTLLRREVWLTTTVHMAASAAVTATLLPGAGALGLGLVAGHGWRTYVVIAFALSFSSTVVVVKLLEERGSGQSLGGRTVIGILILQDLAAVVFLSATHGEPPSPWAVLLVLLIPAAWVLRRMLRSLGHGELRLLFGLTMALAPGYVLFEAVGLKGDLGALVMGTLLAFHQGAGELAKSLLSLKELMLVGFFLSIGFVGLPAPEHVATALVLLLLLPLKTIGYAALLWAVGMRRRTAVLAGTALGNFSEFGLIVSVSVSADVLSDDWLVIMATTMAASFTLSALSEGRSEFFVGLARRLLPDRDPGRILAEDRPIDVAHAQAVVLGMGRVGRASYDRLLHEYALTVIGVETVATRVEHLRARGYDVVEGDATDPDFWARLRTADDVQMAVLAMPFHGNNLDALAKLTAGGFTGTVAVVAQYDAELEQSYRHGAHTGIQLYEGAGAELADRAATAAGVQRGPGG